MTGRSGASGASGRRGVVAVAVLMATLAWSARAVAEPDAPVAQEAVVWWLGRAWVGELALDGDAPPTAYRRSFEVVGVDPAGRPLLRHRTWGVGGSDVSAEVHVAVEPGDLLPRAREAVTWAPPGEGAPAVRLDAGTAVVPASDGRLRWYDGLLCGELPAEAVDVGVVAPRTEPPAPSTHAGDVRHTTLVLRAVPGGDVLATTDCPTPDPLAEAAAAWSWEVWRQAARDLLFLERLDQHGDDLLVEVRGMRATVRGWVTRDQLGTVMTRTFTCGSGGGGRPYEPPPPRPPLPWPLGELPSDAPLHDRREGAVVGRLTSPVIGVPLCEPGTWHVATVATPWGTVELRIDPRHAVRAEAPPRRCRGRPLGPARSVWRCAP